MDLGLQQLQPQLWLENKEQVTLKISTLQYDVNGEYNLKERVGLLDLHLQSKENLLTTWYFQITAKTVFNFCIQIL